MKTRTKKSTMPGLEDIAMMILGFSESLHNGDWAVNYVAWDQYKPPGWPTARYILGFFGYPRNRGGWERFIKQTTGLECLSLKHIRMAQGERAMATRWNMENKPEYTARPDEYYQAATWGDTMPICEKTYRQTGRIVLR